MSAWQRFWFSETDGFSYALLRLGLGLVGMLGLIGLTPISMYWSSDGLAPAAGGGVGLREMLVSSGVAPLVGYGLYGGLALTFACMVVGYRSSIAVITAFVGSALQGFWNPLPLSSSHKVLVALLFCLMWADSGRALSVDARRGNVVNDRVGTTAIWPLRLARLQIAVIYLSSGVMKLFGDPWRDGTALHYTLQLNAFHRFPSEVPASLEWLLTTMTYVTLAWELGFVLLILNRRTRVITLWFGVAMHLAMAAMLELGTFSAVMLVGYVAFADPARVRRLVPSLRKSSAVLDASL